MKNGFDISFFGDKALEGETIEGKPLNAHPFGLRVGMPIVVSGETFEQQGTITKVNDRGFTVDFSPNSDE